MGILIYNPAMDLFLAFASSAAIGSLLGLVLKELFDLWRSRRAHRDELQRRYFDAKLDATIRAIQQIKTSSSTLRGLLTFARQNEETKGWIAPRLISGVTQSMVQTLERINEQTAGVVALLGFYYDDALVQLVEQGTNPTTTFLQDVSKFLLKVQRHGEIGQLLGAPIAPATILRQELEREQTSIESEISALINKMAEFADRLDNLTNETIRRMRHEYRSIRF